MFIPSTSPTFYHLRLLYTHMSRPTFPPLLCTSAPPLLKLQFHTLFTYSYFYTITYIFLSAFHWRYSYSCYWYTGIPKTIISRIIYLPNLLVINSTHIKIFILVRRILYNNNNYYICPDILTSVFFFYFHFVSSPVTLNHTVIYYIIIPHIIYVHVIPHEFLDTPLGLEPIRGAYYIVHAIHAANLYYHNILVK